jgi:antirestriction protein
MENETMNATTSPRVYVACLASYNAGRLHGAWIDANQDADDIRDQVSAMLAASPEPGAEEWAIHDHEGLGDIGEHESLDRIAELGQAIAGAGDDAAAQLAWLDNQSGRDPADFADVYRGHYDSLTDYVEELWAEQGFAELADKMAGGSWWNPVRYIDWERMARDLELSGDVETIDSASGVYVFDNQ